MTTEELKTILENHAKWLRNELGGIRADLRSANLRSADLRYADLSSADLRSADLRYADLSSANLRSADLRSADLRYADLSSANLRSANLSCANLSSANLSSANLSYANLRSANLRSADLRYADLSSKQIEKQQIVPQEGAFICFKKAYEIATGLPHVLKLQIPEGAYRVGGLVGRKCRANQALVLAVVAGDLKDSATVFRAGHDTSFLYEIGKEVSVSDYDGSPLVECAPGIHFFMTRQEALEY